MESGLPSFCTVTGACLSRNQWFLSPLLPHDHCSLFHSICPWPGIVYTSYVPSWSSLYSLSSFVLLPWCILYFFLSHQFGAILRISIFLLLCRLAPQRFIKQISFPPRKYKHPRIQDYIFTLHLFASHFKFLSILFSFIVHMLTHYSEAHNISLSGYYHFGVHIYDLWVQSCLPSSSYSFQEIVNSSTSLLLLLWHLSHNSHSATMQFW